MRWNLFKQPESAIPTTPGAIAPENAAQSSAGTMPDNSALVGLIQDMKLNTLMGDMRPLHRAIMTAQFLVPLSEPPTVTPQGTRMRYLTFDHPVFGPQSTLALFTDAPRMREFLGSNSGLGAQVCVGFWDGQTACNAAMQGELLHLAINPASDAHYAMPPHVYRALAFGYAPSSVADAPITAPHIAIARPLSGLPSAPELQAWHAVLSQHGAQEAFWFNVLLDEVKELRYGIGVMCELASFEAIRTALVSAWLGLWPVNTPLFVYHLTCNSESQAIRAGGEPIFP